MLRKESNMGKSAAIETRHYLTCLWPGLSELWWRGRLSALPAAIVFAVAINLLLVVRFLYPGWLSGWLVMLACWVGAAAWVFYVIRSVKELPKMLAPREVSDKPDHFQDAQFAYLRGEWEESEQLLMEVLAIEPRDPPALLLLSSVYRHTERSDMGHLLLRELSRLEIGDTWALEIEAEMTRIERDQDSSDDDETEDSEEESNQDKTEKHGESTADLTAA